MEHIKSHQTFQIIPISFYGSYFDDGSYHVDNFLPIPLTEEWLIKLGFTWDRHNERLQINEDFYFENSKLWIGLPDGQFWRYLQVSSSRWEYVHQLQNLYFALTGEDLTIKEPAL